MEESQRPPNTRTRIASLPERVDRSLVTVARGIGVLFSRAFAAGARLREAALSRETLTAAQFVAEVPDRPLSDITDRV